MAKAYDFVFLIAGMGVQMEESDVITGIRQVLNDNSFKINNPVTIEARGQAECLLESCLIEANKEKLDAFTEHILQDLKGIMFHLQPNPFITIKIKCGEDSFHYALQRTLTSSGPTFRERVVCKLSWFCISI